MTMSFAILAGFFFLRSARNVVSLMFQKISQNPVKFAKVLGQDTAILAVNTRKCTD